MSKKKNPGDVVDAMPSKSDVRRATGKRADEPNVGRTNKNGERAPTKQIEVKPSRFNQFKLPIVGMEAPVIVHSWGVKAIREMLGKHMGVDGEALRTDKDPFADFLDGLYRDRTTGELTLRSVMFKTAAIEAIRYVSGVSKIDAMTSFYVCGEYSPLYGWPMNRLDPVRIGMWPNETSDIRFRPEFPEWATELSIRYNPEVISQQAIVNLLVRAGESMGVGEWRGQKGGVNGFFAIYTGDDWEAHKQSLGRARIEDLTPENTGTLSVLKEVGLDPSSVVLLKSKPSSPGQAAAPAGAVS